MRAFFQPQTFLNGRRPASSALGGTIQEGGGKTGDKAPVYLFFKSILIIGKTRLPT
jgi:hypothetical protein